MQSKEQEAFKVSMNIFVGNLSFNTTEDIIRASFEQFGEIESVNLIVDRDTGRSRGFCFVEMPNEDEARAAIAAMAGREIDGRALNVNEARPREERGGGGRSGGGGGGYRGGGSGGGGGRSGGGGGGGQRRNRW